MGKLIKRIEPPREDWTDIVEQAASRGIDAVTFGFGSLVLDIWLPTRLDRRKAEFQQDVKDGLDRLEEQGRIDRARIESHDQFISNYTEAVFAAIRTHQKEKREALRNAVLNTALGNAPHETQQQIFMGWISELTPRHVALLEHLLTVPERLSGSLEHEVVNKFPDLRDTNLAGVIINDLVAKNLIADGRHNVVEPRRSPGAVSLSPLGSAFLAFIREPPELGT